ncbi:MAG: amidohydrolase family protein [Alphaproteobacteria bacterium]|nr:amidohydrolase family protein [Alphaproteobacteria bacterium]
MNRTDTILIAGGRVYDHDGDTDQPAYADVLIEGDRIARVGPHLAATVGAVGRTIDGRDKLVVPGFVNAHYHSHDALLKGCFETIPLELWLLRALPPSWPKRSKEEVRARTLIGAVEALHSGITTIQDMLTVFPFDPEHVEVALDAYQELGVRTVFALQIGNIPGVERVPFWKEMIPPDKHRYLSASVEPFAGIHPIDAVMAEYARHRGRRSLVDWALGPTSPEFCTPDFLERLAALSAEHALPVYMHINESKAMTLAGRLFMPEHGGSQVKYLRATGLIGPRVNLAHSIWMLPEEIDILAETGTNVVLNPVGNMKSKSGVPPIRDFLVRGVNVALGCDNCACSDAQNMFQGMKMLAALSAASEIEPGPPSAADALRAATLGGARTAGLERALGAVKPGRKADLSLIDLTSPAFVPFNSAARQLVFTESGGDVETVIVDGQVVLDRGRVTTISESELRDAIQVLMPGVRRDLAVVETRVKELEPYLMRAYRKAMAADVGTNRLIGQK